jgi:hypothetical protein
MANEEHLAILRQGVEAWNAWRGEHSDVRPDLSEAYLSQANLGEADLTRADLSRALLLKADLSRALLLKADLSEPHLTGADLRGAFLIQAVLSGANLDRANLSGANLFQANLIQAVLSGANLDGANLSRANLFQANLDGANLSGTRTYQTLFSTINFSTVIGLDTVDHHGPSVIGTDTLYLSHGKIPESFLRGCGVPDTLIEYLPSLLGAMQPIQFYSCFISYSSQDEAFAKRLHERMQAEHLRVWFAPKDMQAGQYQEEQIEQAIRVYDKLLVILSPNSRQSKWVMAELRKARTAELQTNRRKLFPIRLMPVKALDSWECIDLKTGQDIAAEVRKYHIPDFSRWKQDHDAFERAFARLLRDLKATDAPPAPAPAPVATPSVSGQIDIAQQQVYLTTHRRTLASYLQRLALLTTAHAPPEITHGIIEARANIARVKAILRASGVQVPDHPDDTEA